MFGAFPVCMTTNVVIVAFLSAGPGHLVKLQAIAAFPEEFVNSSWFFHGISCMWHVHSRNEQGRRSVERALNGRPVGMIDIGHGRHFPGFAARLGAELAKNTSYNRFVRHVEL